MSTDKQTLFPCEQCGAKITFDPAKGGQVCPYCGHETAIEHAYAGIEELDFRAYFDNALRQSDIVEAVTVRKGEIAGHGATIAMSAPLESAFSPPPVLRRRGGAARQQVEKRAIPSR
mgnify:CR=1 FL=1